MSDSDNSIWRKATSFRRTPRDEQQAAEGQETAVDPVVERRVTPRPPKPPATPVAASRETPAVEGVRRPPPPPHVPSFVREEPVAVQDPPPPPPPPASAPPHLRPVESEPYEIEPEESRPPLPPVADVPAPVVVHPPVPAAELPPEPKPEKVPFWKKDVAVRKAKDATTGPKAEKTKRVKQPKPPRTPKAEKTKRVKQPKPPRTPRAEQPKRTPKPKTEKTAGAPRVVRASVLKRQVTLRSPERKRAATEPVKQAKRLVGLKIGASQLAAARVANGASPELLQIARTELRPGIVVGGELRDPEALSTALREFFDTHKLPKREVRLGIANNRIGVRTFDLVGIEDPRQLDNAVRFRAQEALPIPIDDAVLDYQVLSESRDDEGNAVQRILLVVAYRELIDRYVQACRKAGLRLVGIDLEAFALLRTLSAPRSQADAEAAVVAVAVGHQRSTFAVSDGRTCQFTRVLDWGGGSLDLAVARQLDVPTQQAGSIKRTVSLAPGVPLPEGLSAEQGAAVLDAVRNSLQTFARELVSSLQYYQNQPGSLGIGEIVLTGGTAHMPGIAEELQRLTGVLVRVGDPLRRVRVGKRVAEGNQIGSFAVAIGLGIED